LEKREAPRKDRMEIYISARSVVIHLHVTVTRVMTKVSTQLYLVRANMLTNVGNFQTMHGVSIK